MELMTKHMKLFKEDVKKQELIEKKKAEAAAQKKAEA